MDTDTQIDTDTDTDIDANEDADAHTITERHRRTHHPHTSIHTHHTYPSCCCRPTYQPAHQGKGKTGLALEPTPQAPPPPLPPPQHLPHHLHCHAPPKHVCSFLGCVALMCHQRCRVRSPSAHALAKTAGGDYTNRGTFFCWDLRGPTTHRCFAFGLLFVHHVNSDFFVRVCL